MFTLTFTERLQNRTFKKYFKTYKCLLNYKNVLVNVCVCLCVNEYVHKTEPDSSSKLLIVGIDRGKL